MILVRIKTNSVVPDQTHRFAVSDLGQHCVLRLSDYYGKHVFPMRQDLVSENILLYTAPGFVEILLIFFPCI